MAGKGRWEKDGGWLSRTGPPRKVAMCFIHMESCLYQIVCPSSYWNSWPQTPSFPPLWILFFSLRVLSLSEFCWSYRQSCLCLGLSYQAGCSAASFSVLPAAYSPQCQWLDSLVRGFKALIYPQGLQTHSGSNEWAWNPFYYSKCLGVHINNGGQVTARFEEHRPTYTLMITLQIPSSTLFEHRFSMCDLFSSPPVKTQRLAIMCTKCAHKVVHLHPPPLLVWHPMGSDGGECGWRHPTKV